MNRDVQERVKDLFGAQIIQQHEKYLATSNDRERKKESI